MENHTHYSPQPHPGAQRYEPSYSGAYYSSMPPLQEPQSHLPYYTPNQLTPPPFMSSPRAHPQQTLHPGSSSDSSHYTHLQSPYQNNLLRADANSSSFDSSGSHHSHGHPHVTRVHPGASYVHMMPPPHPGYPGPPYYQWAPPLEMITNIKPTDVLSGRGGATNSHCK